LDKLLLLKAELGSLKEIAQSADNRSTIRTVGDLKNAWQPHLGEAKRIGTEAFSEKVRAWTASDAILAELTALWDKVTLDIDFLTTMLGSMSAPTHLEDFGSRLTPAQNARGEEGFRNFEKIIEGIDAFTRTRSALILLDISATPSGPGVELSEKAFAVFQEIEELKRRYLR
ncbi:MAG: hypothetical protein AAB562_01200, partial [Patescibacteria group bacterium]